MDAQSGVLRASYAMPTPMRHGRRVNECRRVDRGDREHGMGWGGLTL